MIICTVSFLPVLSSHLLPKEKVSSHKVHSPLSNAPLLLILPYLFINLSPVGCGALFGYHSLPRFSVGFISSWSINFKQRDPIHLANRVLCFYLTGVTSPDLKHFLCFRWLSAHFPSLPQARSLFNALLHQMSWWDGAPGPFAAGLTSSLPSPEKQCFPCLLSSSPPVTATTKDMALEPGSPKTHLWLQHLVGNVFGRLLWRENRQERCMASSKTSPWCSQARQHRPVSASSSFSSWPHHLLSFPHSTCDSQYGPNHRERHTPGMQH